VELNTRHDLDGDDRGGDPVDHEAERRPPPSICNEVTSVLPEILEPVTRNAEDENHGDCVMAAAAMMTKITATFVSTAMTSQRPSATAKPM
jgi:hypothetical protein